MKKPNHCEILDRQAVMRGVYRKLLNRGLYDFKSKRSQQVIKRSKFLRDE